jgi:hypothetical protein
MAIVNQPSSAAILPRSHPSLKEAPEMIRPALDPQPALAGTACSEIRRDAAQGIARIVINRPRRRNAFRPETIHQR